MTSPPAATENPKPPRKTLVVGSSGHAHVTNVAWDDLKSVNLRDFDAVVLNVVALNDKAIIRLPRYGFFDQIRSNLSALLASGGSIIVLTPELRSIKNKDDLRIRSTATGIQKPKRLNMDLEAYRLSPWKQ
jgi:hypothetical protein